MATTPPSVWSTPMWVATPPCRLPFTIAAAGRLPLPTLTLLDLPDDLLRRIADALPAHATAAAAATCRRLRGVLADEAAAALFLALTGGVRRGAAGAGGGEGYPEGEGGQAGAPQPLSFPSPRSPTALRTAAAAAAAAAAADPAATADVGAAAALGGGGIPVWATACNRPYTRAEVVAEGAAAAAVVAAIVAPPDRDGGDGGGRHPAPARGLRCRGCVSPPGDAAGRRGARDGAAAGRRPRAADLQPTLDAAAGWWVPPPGVPRVIAPPARPEDPWAGPAVAAAAAAARAKGGRCSLPPAAALRAPALRRHLRLSVGRVVTARRYGLTLPAALRAAVAAHGTLRSAQRTAADRAATAAALAAAVAARQDRWGVIAAAAEVPPWAAAAVLSGGRCGDPVPRYVWRRRLQMRGKKGAVEAAATEAEVAAAAAAVAAALAAAAAGGVPVADEPDDAAAAAAAVKSSSDGDDCGGSGDGSGGGGGGGGSGGSGGEAAPTVSSLRRLVLNAAALGSTAEAAAAAGAELAATAAARAATWTATAPVRAARRAAVGAEMEALGLDPRVEWMWPALRGGVPAVAAWLDGADLLQQLPPPAAVPLRLASPPCAKATTTPVATVTPIPTTTTTTTTSGAAATAAAAAPAAATSPTAAAAAAGSPSFRAAATADVAGGDPPPAVLATALDLIVLAFYDLRMPLRLILFTPPAEGGGHARVVVAMARRWLRDLLARHDWEATAAAAAAAAGCHQRGEGALSPAAADPAHTEAAKALLRRHAEAVALGQRMNEELLRVCDDG
ncbi:hypothetical protein I4F81_003600 [Pyropia yezoensis]|uniref:Uncharacterized protein n=1 Tax=Pyropia yezoensis TaxID=2788 RepID=A0ACC3BSL3_PYRYE|nr:hypothetical protein I4F81_003600 [Neopyropia yezoensis]